MICPACGKGLTEMSVAEIKVDVCRQGCNGVWLDNYEIEKMDEAHESAGEMLLEFVSGKPPQARAADKRRCPKCGDVAMQRFFYSVRKEVEVDDCPGCGGTWLDADELSSIRKEYKTENDRKQAGEKFFSKLFDSDLAAQAANSQAELARKQRFAKAFKYVLPSYWIPGKQQGGAF